MVKFTVRPSWRQFDHLRLKIKIKYPDNIIRINKYLIRDKRSCKYSKIKFIKNQ